MKKIITVIGARPQFVKAAVVSRAIKANADLTEMIIHTGQHFDANMSDVFFDEMDIPKPHFNLNINGLGHGAMTGQMLEGIEKILIQEKPEIVLVYGDTNSTLAGALAATKLHIKVAHVEAGLRSFNWRMPEEVNRVLTDKMSDWLLCPTQTAISNLITEGYNDKEKAIINVGDVMFDAALYYSNVSASRALVAPQFTGNPFVLVTLHRAENTDEISNLKAILTSLNAINETIQVVLPIHPRTRKIIQNNQLNVSFTMIDPVGYFDMIELLKNCSLVMTDSGGLQKEAYFFQKNCITMRDQTEWVELVDNGFNLLTGANEIKILAAFKEMFAKPNDFSKVLYGTGNAGDLIANILASN
jgi:UDP-GlcNAc3NAcA epimerase